MRLAVWLILLAAGVHGADIFLHGKVVMEDGSAPPQMVSIERSCTDNVAAIRETSTNRKGEYIWHVVLDPLTTVSAMASRDCVLRAWSKEYESTSIDVTQWKWYSDPVLPPITLRARSSDPGARVLSEAKAPAKSSRAWEQAAKAAEANNWAEAERQLRGAVAADPKFAAGWHALGIVYQNEHKTQEAREAQRRALAINPKLHGAYLYLARLELEAGAFDDALKAADTFIAADAKHRFPEAYLDRAIALYQLKRAAEAEQSAKEALRLDQKHEISRAEYVLGLILASRKDEAGAREHMSRYLELDPKASDAAAVRERMANLGREDVGAIATELQQVAAKLTLAPAGEAWVPGGRKALAAAAHLETTPSYDDFFTAFSAALAREASPGLARGIPRYAASITMFISVVTELARLGTHQENGTAITLSLADRRATEHVLNLLGWQVVGDQVAPGDQAGDGIRQKIPAWLGIDEIAMRDALNAGRTFEFTVVTQSARLMGGDAWGSVVKGGIAEGLVADPKVAETYAALSAMGAETAVAVVEGVGLTALVDRYADVLWRDGAAFAIGKDGVATPGDPAVWKKLAGADPKMPANFFRAVLDRDQGGLAAFYYAMSQADVEHQKFVAARAEKFYAWYRNSGEWRWSLALKRDRWRAEALRLGPLNDVVLSESTVPVAALKVDEASGRMIAARYAQWRPLFPYFETLRLGRAEFEALAAFTDSARVRDNAVMGDWYALVELTARGVRAGSLTAEQGASAFRHACEGQSAAAVAREIAGGPGDLRHLIAKDLLKLSGDRRAAHDFMLELQKGPMLAAAVYAATFDPEGLLVNEDAELLKKHRFVAGDAESPFAAAKLVSTSAGSYFTGGFMGLDAIARGLASGGKAAPRVAAPVEARVAAQGEEAVSAEVTFHADARLVEVFATVTDARGRYVDDLSREQFTILEQGKAQTASAFESRASEVSVALLLDSTGSMQAAMPALKNAALKLIGEMRAVDSVAVYHFNDAVNEAQAFTTDKSAAARAVLRAQPMGDTALYDALARVNRDLSGRSGKKVIVVFTDGDDNSSTLTSAMAIRRAKASGVPVYTIAQGEALRNPEFLKQLAGLSQATGGAAFTIHNAAEIRAVFEGISQDLQHGYFFAFQPSAEGDRAWRTIDVVVRGQKSYKVRAREGYIPQ